MVIRLLANEFHSSIGTVNVVMAVWQNSTWYINGVQKYTGAFTYIFSLRHTWVLSDIPVQMSTGHKIKSSLTAVVVFDSRSSLWQQMSWYTFDVQRYRVQIKNIYKFRSYCNRDIGRLEFTTKPKIALNWMTTFCLIYNSQWKSHDDLH